jgi:hypothetical protein
MNRIARSILSLLLCATASVLFAQQPVNRSAPAAGLKPPVAQPPAPAVPPVVAPNAPPVPELSHEDSLELENLQLKASLLQQQQTQLQNQYQVLVKGLNAKHPGFTFNVQTGKFMPLPSPETPKK